MAFLGVDQAGGRERRALHSASFLPSDVAVEHAARVLAAMYVGAARMLGAVGD
ncbi:hypothetical protein [Arthrobacter mobilis]|uniref:Uncharacterized protein n=1 Tax=Arthrobacter mobilis TaxID=2724944 RepID=A0A7X6HDI6_9MICC|nr:hypothetical protein [Arthrobacter mobilis]NKX54168.1 hypothetical protein [Arthrobacter mobilis]